MISTSGALGGKTERVISAFGSHELSIFTYCTRSWAKRWLKAESRVHEKKRVGKKKRSFR